MPDDPAPGPRAVERLMQTIAQFEARARATLADAGTGPRPIAETELRDAAARVLTRLPDLRRVLRADLIDPLDVVQAIEAALELGLLTDEAVRARVFWVRQIARARRAAAIKRAQHQRADEALRVVVDRIRGRRPTLSCTAIARLLDATHVDRMRKRIARLDLARKTG